MSRSSSSGVLCVRLVTWQQTGVVELVRPRPGFVLRITGIILKTVQTWNGVGADLDVGTHEDADGLYDGSANGFVSASTNGGYYGEPLGANKMGAKLYDATEKRLVAWCVPAFQVRVHATVTPGTGASAGRTWVTVIGTQIPNPS